MKINEKLNRINELHNGQIDSYLDGNDIDWLIKTVEQLSKYIEELENHCDDWDWIERNKPKFEED